MMRRSLIIIIATVLAFPLSALVLGARGGKVDKDAGVIKVEVHGTLHFQEGQGYFISVKSRKHPGWENRVWLLLSENKVILRQLEGLKGRKVVAQGELEQMPDNVRASFPTQGMYLNLMEQIVEAK
jgi:hypothetical protein